MMFVSMRNCIWESNSHIQFDSSENRVKTGESPKQSDDLHGRICLSEWLDRGVLSWHRCLQLRVWASWHSTTASTILPQTSPIRTSHTRIQVGRLWRFCLPITLNDFRDEKPDNCDVVPQSACAVAYDSGTCSGKKKGIGNFLHNLFKGGWKLVIPVGELRFRWFTSYWSYRLDASFPLNCGDFSWSGMTWTLWEWGLAAPWLHTVTAATMGTELTSSPPPLTGKSSKMQLCFLKSDSDGLCLLTTRNTNIWTVTLSPSDVSVDISCISIFCTP